jgi:hypothetical protein
VGVTDHQNSRQGRYSAPYQLPAAEPAAQPTGAPATAAPAMSAPPGSPEDLREKQYEKAAQNGFDKSGNPVASQSQNKSFFLDFLLQ